jgi:hypothetical protein
MAERDTEMIAWRGGALAFRTGDGMTATDPPLLLWEELAAEVSVLRKRAERAEASEASTLSQSIKHLREVTERAERAESERDAVQACYDKQLTATKEQRLRACAAEAENARLREVLEWYEPRLSDCRKLGSIREGEEARADLSRDGGERARAALRPADAGEGVG